MEHHEIELQATAQQQVVVFERWLLVEKVQVSHVTRDIVGMDQVV